jgi:DNA modification methylase
VHAGPPADSFLVDAAARIRALGKRVIADAIEIGRLLADCKDRCGHGNWLPWLEREFGWSDQQARRFIHVHELSCEGKFNKLLNLAVPISGLYLLAAPSTSEAARAAVVDRAEAGERLKHAEVRDIIVAHSPAAHRGTGAGDSTQKSTIRFLQGDCREVLPTLPAESMHSCVTSPPYWGLRDFGIPPTIWGGNPGCRHEFICESVDTEVGRGNWSQGTNGRDELQPGGVAFAREPIRSTAERGFCRFCSAWRGCLGLEPTVDLYVEHMVEVFREVRRVLRKDGVCFLNLGDSFASSVNGGSAATTKSIGNGLKPKDLCGVPWEVALALRRDGWWLRSDIVWAKPNPMPESITDRPTRSHEYVFLLTKSPRAARLLLAVHHAVRTPDPHLPG